MAQWHTVDLTNFDVAPAARRARGTSGSVANRAIELTKEVAYVSVGLGLLTFQRAQVQRRELERALRS